VVTKLFGGLWGGGWTPSNVNSVGGGLRDDASGCTAGSSEDTIA
jgi:hypothetical protein